MPFQGSKFRVSSLEGSQGLPHLLLSPRRILLSLCRMSGYAVPLCTLPAGHSSQLNGQQRLRACPVAPSCRAGRCKSRRLMVVNVAPAAEAPVASLAAGAVAEFIMPHNTNCRSFSFRSAWAEVAYVLVARVATVRRSTKETNVEVSINLDGSGVCTANTPVHFLNHMLDVRPHFLGSQPTHA